VGFLPKGQAGYVCKNQAMLQERPGIPAGRNARSFFYRPSQNELAIDFFNLKKLDLPKLPGAAFAISEPPKFLHAA
jgi:hypothetical protein